MPKKKVLETEKKTVAEYENEVVTTPADDEAKDFAKSQKAEVIRNVGHFSGHLVRKLGNMPTRDSMQRNAFNYLKKSKENQYLEWGEVIGVEEISTIRAKDYSRWAVIVAFEHKQHPQNWGTVYVRIPESKFYESGIIFCTGYDNLPVDVQKDIRGSFLMGYIGSMCDFVVSDLQEFEANTEENHDQYIIIGDRCEAMKKQRYIHFFDPQRKTNIERGSKVEGFIVRKTDEYVVVSSLGCECIIRRYELPINIFTNYRGTGLNVGDKLDCRVRSVKFYGKQGVAMSLTCKLPEPVSNYNFMKVGTVVRGVVTKAAKENGIVSVILKNNVPGIVHVGQVKENQMLSPGDNVMFKIHDIFEDKYVIGSVKRIY